MITEQQYQDASYRLYEAIQELRLIGQHDLAGKVDDVAVDLVLRFNGEQQLKKIFNEMQQKSSQTSRDHPALPNSRESVGPAFKGDWGLRLLRPSFNQQCGGSECWCARPVYGMPYDDLCGGEE